MREIMERMAELKTLQVSVTGTDEHLTRFAQLCRTMEYLGNVGSTRTIKIWCDGDGAARMRFSFDAPSMQDIPPLPEGRDGYRVDFE